MTIADRVKDTTTTTGLGNLTLEGAPPMNFRPVLTAPIVVGSLVPITVVHRTQPEWESGLYKLVAPLELERTTVKSSSNNGQTVNFSAGIKDVSCDLTTALIDTMSGIHNITIQTVANPSEFNLAVIEGETPKQIKLADISSTFQQIPSMPLPLVESDEVELFRSGFGEGRATLTAVAAVIAAINGTSTSADTTAPVLSSPSGSATGTTTATGTVTTNESTGTLYCLASTSNVATAEQVKAGLSQTVTSIGIKTFSIASLTASTTYYLHFLHKDGAGNESAIVISSSFGTAIPGDTTAPTLSSPSGVQTGATSASGSVTTNEGNGTLYFLYSTANTATAAQVKAGDSKEVTAAGAQPVTKTGLTASTSYYVHFLHRDAAGNDSAVSTSVSFTTASVSDTTAPTLSSPTGTQTGATTASGTVSTTEGNGTLFRFVSINASESVATVKAANLTSQVTAAGVQNVTFAGLTASTQYYAHYVHTDTAGNDSARVSSAAFTTEAAPVTNYTITGYNGNVVKDTLDVSAVIVYGGKRGVLAEPFTNLYWNISPTPASAISGWGESPTVPPAVVSAADNLGTSAAGGNDMFLNGMVPMGKPSAWQVKAKLWVPVGTDPDKKWYYWIKPVDGVAQCINLSGMTATGA